MMATGNEEERCSPKTPRKLLRRSSSTIKSMLSKMTTSPTHKVAVAAETAAGKTPPLSSPLIVRQRSKTRMRRASFMYNDPNVLFCSDPSGEQHSFSHSQARGNRRQLERANTEGSGPAAAAMSFFQNMRSMDITVRNHNESRPPSLRGPSSFRSAERRSIPSPDLSSRGEDTTDDLSEHLDSSMPEEMMLNGGSQGHDIGGDSIPEHASAHASADARANTTTEGSRGNVIVAADTTTTTATDTGMPRWAAASDDRTRFPSEARCRRFSGEMALASKLQDINTVKVTGWPPCITRRDICKIFNIFGDVDKLTVSFNDRRAPTYNARYADVEHAGTANVVLGAITMMNRTKLGVRDGAKGRSGKYNNNNRKRPSVESHAAVAKVTASLEELLSFNASLSFVFVPRHATRRFKRVSLAYASLYILVFVCGLACDAYICVAHWTSRRPGDFDDNDGSDNTVRQTGQALMLSYFTMLLMNAATLQKKYRQGQHMLRPIKLVGQDQIPLIRDTCRTVRRASLAAGFATLILVEVTNTLGGLYMDHSLLQRVISVTAHTCAWISALVQSQDRYLTRMFFRLAAQRAATHCLASDRDILNAKTQYVELRTAVDSDTAAAQSEYIICIFIGSLVTVIGLYGVISNVGGFAFVCAPIMFVYLLWSTSMLWQDARLHEQVCDWMHSLETLALMRPAHWHGYDGALGLVRYARHYPIAYSFFDLPITKAFVTQFVCIIFYCFGVIVYAAVSLSG